MPSLGLRQLFPLVILLAIGSAVVSEPRALAGSGLLSWDLPSTDDPGGAHLGGSAPAASDPVVLLGWINNTQGGGAVGNSTAVENIFSIAASPYPTDGQWWDLGRGIPHNSTGVTNFTASDDPDFPAIATLLTDGLDGFIRMETVFVPGAGGMGGGGQESYLLQRNPDFVGNEVDIVRLNITDFSLSYSGGMTSVFENVSWEIWGRPVFVFFVPPTEPDNTYLVDRNSTIVRVRLAAIGVATLEWDGVNRSMLADGPNWSASVLGLRNGAYSYRVWATNETGAPFATPIRHLSVGVGIWRIEQVGYGFWPSVTVNATGYPRMCYYGGGGLFYAERSPSGWWTNATIDGGGQACSITVNSRGEARISHLAGTADGNYDIRYAYQRDGNWSTATVQHGFYTYTSIAMNPITDEPMIAYSQVSTEGLKLATLSHDVWTTQVVDPSFYGQSMSLAINSTGNPAIAYWDYTRGALRVAQWTGTRWMITTLSERVTATSIGFDAGGVAHVAYASDAGLLYATWNGTGWSTESVDRGRYYAVSLSYDSLNRAHIGYATDWGGDVRETVKEGPWRIQVISHGKGGGGASFAAMPGGTGVASFTLNDANGHLVFASDFVDTRPPATRVFLNGAIESPGLFSSAVRVRIETEDEWSGVSSLEYRFDGGPWIAYSDAFLVSSEGRHVLEVRATDGAGNVGVESVAFVIDLNPFSFSGPLHGAPTILAAITAVAVLGLLFWIRYDKARVEALQTGVSPDRGLDPSDPQVRYCPACGAPLIGAGQYCTNCGIRLTPAQTDTPSLPRPRL